MTNIISNPQKSPETGDSFKKFMKEQIRKETTQNTKDLLDQFASLADLLIPS